MTYGLSMCGYDIRIDQDVILWPGRFVLASSLESFNVPPSIVGRVCDKSTWARRGVTVQNTVIEPGWRGWLTLELVNHSWRFIKIRQGDPIAQVLFEWLDEPTVSPYEGKYQDQPARPVAAVMELAQG